MVTLSLGIELTFTLKLWLRKEMSLDKIEVKCIPISPFGFQRATAMPTMAKIVDVPTPHADMNTSAIDVSQANLIQHSCASRQESTVVIPKSLEEVLPRKTNPVSPIQSNNSDALPTPVNARAFLYLLVGYKYREYIVRGFTEGFPIQFEGVEEELKLSNSNAALLNPDAVDTKLQKELEACRVAGAFNESLFKNLKCSPKQKQKCSPLFIREKGTSGQYRFSA